MFADLRGDVNAKHGDLNAKHTTAAGQPPLWRHRQACVKVCKKGRTSVECQRGRYNCEVLCEETDDRDIRQRVIRGHS